MDEFTTSRPQRLRNEGGGGWTIAAVLVVLLLIIGLIGLGSSGGTPSGTGDAAPSLAPGGDSPAPPAE